MAISQVDNPKKKILTGKIQMDKLVYPKFVL